MKKSILFVINSMGVGGAEKSLVSMLSAFDYKKYDVDLLMFNRSGLFLDLVPDEVNILPVPGFLAPVSSFAEQIKSPKYFAARVNVSYKLRKNARQKKLHPAQCYWKYTNKCFDNLEREYDAAVAWGQGNPTHFVAQKVKADLKIAFINADYTNVGHNKDFDLKYYSEYKYIAAVSNELNDKIKNVFPCFSDRVRTIYDINNAELIRQMANAGNPFDKISNKLILVTVGRLMPYKGYDLAVEAAKILRNQKVDFKWFFVGEGTCREELEKKIEEYGLEDNVILTGATDNPYVYIKNADIYVQTSRYEGYCLTIGEARILNKPVISTNFDVVFDQLVNGENGLIVGQNGEEIANAVIRLSTDDNLRNHITYTLTKEKKGNVEELDKFYELLES